MKTYKRLIALLAERINELSRRVNQPDATEQDRKMLDRTRELSTLDAVALTLSQAGNLKDMLDKSLARIFDSLTGLEPRGGVFLCETNGEQLRLTAHQGLSAEFVQREETVRMGECLYSKVARTGELLYTEQGCVEPYHTDGNGAAPHAHLVVPIKSRGIVLGVVFLYPNKDFSVNSSDLQMLEMIGAQLGLAIENFRFYAEVKEASDKYWDLFENARDILFTVDPEGRLTSVNKSAEKFSGYSRMELIGRNVLDFLTRESAQAAVRVLGRANQPRIFEFEVVKRDNSRAFVEVSARRLFKNRATVGFQISARDMTEQKNLREMLVKAERLGAIGQVGIAMRHEINNPLTTVIGNVELLLGRYAEKHKDVEARLEVILNNALRIAEIIKRVEELKQDKVVEYLKGVKMTDLNNG
jgi:two-component system NtrC family sensor kinase